ncbi:TPA: hypothetical protein ACGUWI_002148 [Vibrio vulnificus]
MKKITALLALFSSFTAASADLTLQEEQYKILMTFNSTEMTAREAMTTEGAVAPLIPVIAAGAGGAILGAMGTVASNNNAGIRDIAGGAFGGAVAGALTPVMGGTVIAGVAAGGLGMSASGACGSCHM